jgi:hypothetical protein
MGTSVHHIDFAALPATEAEYLRPVVDRLGYFGDFFKVLANVPGAIVGFMEYTKAVKQPLDDGENEVIALAVCAGTGADYERIQHERLAQRLGFSLEWIAAASGREGASPAVLSDTERLLRRMVEAFLAGGATALRPIVAEAADAIGSTRTMAALLQLTRYAGIATLCTALQLELPVNSVFD